MQIKLITGTSRSRFHSTTLALQASRFVYFLAFHQFTTQWLLTMTQEGCGTIELVDPTTAVPVDLSSSQALLLPRFPTVSGCWKIKSLSQIPDLGKSSLLLALWHCHLTHTSLQVLKLILSSMHNSQGVKTINNYKILKKRHQYY